MRKIISGRRPFGAAFKFKVDLSKSSSGSSGSTTMILPFYTGSPQGGGAMSMSIDWGDGSTTELNNANHSTARSHTYSSTGIYLIQIRGAIRGWEFGAMGSGFDDAVKVTSIEQWGDFIFNENRAFTGCSELVEIICTDLPYFEFNGAGFNMFSGCTSLLRINRINEWNVSNLTLGYSMFFNCQKLQFGNLSNGPINLSGWDVSNFGSMEFMFQNCKKFNAKMFAVTSTTTNLTSMFFNANDFNNGGTFSIESWDTSNVTKMNSTFSMCYKFDRDISSWDTSSVTDMRYMFSGSNNQMVFNQPIGSWDTSSVVRMDAILRNCNSFDQNLSNWDLTALNTNQGGSQIPLCTSVSNSFTFPMVLSTANYDALLIALDTVTYPSWPTSTIGFGLSQYSAAPSAAATARASLVTKFGGIEDGGPI